MSTDKPIEQITAADLENLVSNGVGESRTLEYKEELPGSTDQDKREFLADVSSFANAIGGDLIFGGRERRDEGGKPTSTLDGLVGVAAPNLDQTIQRLENILRDGIAPRIPGIRFWPVPAFERGPVLIVRIPRSWAAPHMVTFQQSAKFFTRHSGGKHQLDVAELRDAFLNSRSASERAEEFRTARLGRVIGGGAAVSLCSERVLCVHAVPHGSLFGALAVDLHKAAGNSAELRPMAAGGWGPRFNIDGVISVSGGAAPRTTTTGYVQLFRNGIVEVVFSDIYFEPPPDMRQAEVGVGSGEVAKELVGVLDRLQRLFRILEVPAPISVFISLHGMRDVVFHVSQQWARYGRYVFDRETVLLPEIVMQSSDASVTAVLRPALDALWQAAGFERCFDYADDGRWAPRP